MLKKIAVTGPECSGKTTLCKALAAKLNCLWVPEMARTILEKEGPEYDAPKVESMARIQMEEENRLANQAAGSGHEWLFCDTDLIVYKIWMEERFGFCPAWIREGINQSGYTLTILLKPDLLWEADPLRENPLNRDYLFRRFQNTLIENNLPWKEIDGFNRELKVLHLLSEFNV